MSVTYGLWCFCFICLSNYLILIEKDAWRSYLLNGKNATISEHKCQIRNIFRSVILQYRLKCIGYNYSSRGEMLNVMRFLSKRWVQINISVCVYIVILIITILM